MRMSDWSSDVCAADLPHREGGVPLPPARPTSLPCSERRIEALHSSCRLQRATNCHRGAGSDRSWFIRSFQKAGSRSEEHTSELQSLMRISYAVFCLKKKKYINIKRQSTYIHNCKNCE